MNVVSLIWRIASNFCFITVVLLLILLYIVNCKIRKGRLQKSRYVVFRYSCAIRLRKFSAISWREQVTFWWDDDIRYVLDQRAEFDLYSANPLKQQSTERYFAPLLHIILIPIQPVFALVLYRCMLSDTYNFIVFVLLDFGSNPRSTTLTTTL
jgi:hypothetical protein